MLRSLYRCLLGKEFDKLPPALQKLHDIRGIARAAGRLDIETNESRLGQILGLLLGLPRAQKDVAVRLTVESSGGLERWERSFGHKRFVSWQKGRGDMFIESFGPLAVGFTLVASETELRFVHRRTWWLGIPWPRPLGPRISAAEIDTTDGWQVDVRLSLPLLGPLLRYHGIMRQE